MKNKMFEDGNLKKIHTIKLKNGEVVELTRQDVIDNNIYKLKEKIPNLKIADTLSDNNPLKKIMIILECGVQNKNLYYKILSLFVFCYIWLIQIMAFVENSPSAWSILLISIWGSYAVIRLQIKPYLEVNTLSSVVSNNNSKLYNNSIAYSLLIALFLFVSINVSHLCYPISWGSIRDLLLFQNVEANIYYEYAFTIMALVASLLCLYNPYNLYEIYMFRLFLGFVTVPLAIFSFIVLGVFLYYYNILVSNMCPENIRLFLYSIIFIVLYILLFAFLQCVSVVVFLFLNRVSKFFNSH